jgi:nucleotide-binding universal stress UspA family protein
MFKKILVPVDFCDLAQGPLALALSMLAPDGELVALAVIDDLCPNPDVFAFQLPWADYHRQLEEEAERRLSDLVARAGAPSNARARVMRGQPARTIVRVAAEEGFDLVVMATHGARGLQHALLGSVTDKVIRQVQCPVLVVRLHPQGHALAAAVSPG